MVVYAYNPSTWEVEARGPQLEASLGYRLYLKKQRNKTISRVRHMLWEKVPKNDVFS
jgi:hypothetical protein